LKRICASSWTITKNYGETFCTPRTKITTFLSVVDMWAYYCSTRLIGFEV